MMSDGTLPSGFSLRIGSAGSLRSVSRISILPPRPRRAMAMRTLRAKGEAGADLRIMRQNLSHDRHWSPATDETKLAQPAAKSPPVARSAGNDQVHGLRALALLVRLDVEADLLSFVQTFKSSRFHGGDVHEHIAPAVIRLHEAVASFAVEELHNTGLRHRENSSPRTAPPPAPRAAARPDIHNRGKRRPRTASVTPPAPQTGGGTYLPMTELHTNWGPVERGPNVTGRPAAPRG